MRERKEKGERERERGGNELFNRSVNWRVGEYSYSSQRHSIKFGTPKSLALRPSLQWGILMQKARKPLEITRVEKSIKNKRRIRELYLQKHNNSFLCLLGNSTC
ncbi:hypothetical protein F0562_020075 [Nyssa sinensis]|uniref:Uncharacterized protein n=1 Tax=Nyssa sinensis TaxID=561372 RepID=A0A5J5BVI4_9ASTE|nr:hypothetical protein F0562_020075 [Nyssa sinensis]